MPTLLAIVGGWDLEGLPDLMGTEKQVAWADALRRKRIMNLHFMVRAFERIACQAGQDRNEYWPKFAVKIEAVFAHDQAKWWIDRRNDSTHWLVGWRDQTEAAERIFRHAMSDL